MRFISGNLPTKDLTYSDVFLVPQKTAVNSRFDIDLSTNDGTGCTIPMVVSNMTAVAGKRMAETVARRGGLVALPQDILPENLARMIAGIKKAHPLYETPVTLSPENTIQDAMNLIYKRAHRAIIIVDDKQKPVGIFTEDDAAGFDIFTPLKNVATTDIVCIKAGMKPSKVYEFLIKNHLRLAPVVEHNKLVGVMTLKSAVRSEIYKPNLDKKGRLKVAVAIGINGDVAAKAKNAIKAGADVLIVDTAHGHQEKMISAIKAAKSVAGKMPVVAGNVVTAEATRELIEAGADIIKVGVGPGAMCTTRMMTGVGRPQFSAVLECSKVARELGAHVWADGGIRHPRDVALAIAAGASNVMFASWIAGTYESVADIQRDMEGRMYKENYGMASRKAVKSRYGNLSAFDQAKKELYEEGISTSRMYLNPEMPGVEDIIDHITAGVRSTCAYENSLTLDELHENSVVGLQSATGFHEGTALNSSWK